ncbi:MAG: MFS transporter [Caldilineae bacterium]|nr:MAG: MFS transporter [Caldilineae bacterium]
MRIPLIGPYVVLLRHNTRYRWLWLAQVISLTGDWFTIIATTALVTRLSASGLAISGLFVARLLPPFFLGPVVGVVADRFDRRKILIASDLLRMLVVPGFLLVRSEETLWLLYALTLLQLSISAFFEPARSALMPAIVARRDLVTANALDGTTWSSMLAIGAALGGVATALFGIETAFLIDSATFGLSAVCVSRIHIPAAAGDDSPLVRQNGFLSYIEGLRYLWHRPHTLVLTLVKGASALSFGAIDIVQVKFAESIFPIGADSSGTLGMIYTAIGIGTGLAPLLARRYSGDADARMRRTITAAFVLSVVGFLGVAWSPSLPLLLAATIVRSSGSGIAWVYSSALLQMTVPDGYRGRVFAFDLAVFTLASATSTFLGGWAFDGPGLSARQVAFACGLVAAGVLGLWLLYRRFEVLKPASGGV